MTLVDFLLARIAEDEATARSCIDDGPHWIPDGQGMLQHDTFIPGEVGCVSGYFTQTRRPLANDHIARHDPARVLAECDAKRRILQEVLPAIINGEDLATSWNERANPNAHPTSILLRRLLALPYADHPDYREEWRP